MPEWTPRQLQAITARNPDILVSAAAGSGKTAVLIERVMSLLREGMQLDRMLVMTFTHAAADEMKERLTELLSEAAAGEEHLRRQFALLGRADISTLHSFCHRLLRRHFQAVGADPLSTLADESVAGELFDRALAEALEAHFGMDGADQAALNERFSGEEIAGMARALYTFLMSQAAPFDWLEAALTQNEQASLYAHPWYDVMVREARLLLQGARDLLLLAQARCQRPDGPARYQSAIQDDLAMARALLAGLEEPQAFTWTKPVFTRLPSTKPGPMEDPELALSVREGLRDQAKALLLQALSLLPRDAQEAADWMARVRATLPQLRALAQLVRSTHDNYQALKQKRALWDFNDLEHLSLQALMDERVRREVTGAYDALFVDEYQDISRIQEAIINRLRGAGNTLFMVGDVKQSIYRFRLADPSLFLEKHLRFSPEEGAPQRLITLRENFRSTGNILRAVNLVFERAMRAGATEIDYDEEARLTTLGDAGGGAPVELWLLEKDSPDTAEDAAAALDELAESAMDEEAGDGTEAPDSGEVAPARGGAGEMERAFVYEARLIARRIRELVGTVTPNQERTLQYRDFAILLRSAAQRASVMAEILKLQDIPTYSDADGEFYTQKDVRDVLNILEVLDNPYQDVPMLSALSCPAFGFSPDELAQMRKAADERGLPINEVLSVLTATHPRCAQAHERLARWRLMAQSMPLEKFLARLLRESGLYAVAGAREDGLLRRANLRILVSRAAPLPEPQNLADFVERTRRAVKQTTRDRSASLGMQENVVRIMTLHKSKGLQFPVVFMPDLAAAFSARRRPTPLIMDAQTGLALVQVDPLISAKQEGFGVRAMKVKKNREELSEEARLMYVGMTRARERLILIGAPKAPLRLQDALPIGDYVAGSAKSMLDWLVPPLFEALAAGQGGLYTAPGGSRWLLAWQPVSALPEQGRKAAAAGELPDSPETKAPDDFFQPLAQGPRYPQKSSVTALVSKLGAQAGLAGTQAPLSALPPDAQAGEGLAALEYAEQSEETLQLKRQPLPQARELRPLLEREKSTELSASQRGAAAHKALCALDPARFAGLEDDDLRREVGVALDELAAKGLLRQAERAALDEAAVRRFYQSALARRMAQSPERHTEWPFTMLTDEEIILQGVLDACFLEDGAWVLVDYKTDRAEPMEVLARYRGQMRWYMRALRDITGLPVKEAWLYLLRSGEMVQVTEAAPIMLGEAEG